MSRFRYLSHGLAVVLLVIGAKMLLDWLWHPPTWLTLAVIVVIVGASIVVSLWSTRGEDDVGSPTPERVSVPS
jgi:tellurite resistance protein TerC